MILILLPASILITILSIKLVSELLAQFLLTVFSAFTFWVLFLWYVVGIVRIDDCHFATSELEGVIVLTGFLTPAISFACIKIIFKIINNR